MQEEWRPAPGWEGLYEVSDLGRVRSLPRVITVRRKDGDRPKPISGRIMKQRLHSGYPVVKLRDAPRAEKVLIHRLVCEAWHGPCPEGLECAHNDGDRTNNRPENLRWTTHLNNMRDKFKHGTMGNRDSLPQSKINSETLAEILARMDAGERNCDIAQDYSVTAGLISQFRTAFRPHLTKAALRRVEIT